MKIVLASQTPLQGLRNPEPQEPSYHTLRTTSLEYI